MFYGRKSRYSLYKPGPRRRSFVSTLLKTIFTAFILYLVVTFFLVSTISVGTEVMLPNIQKTDRLLIFHPVYDQTLFNIISIPGLREPKRGDIVVFRQNYSNNYQWFTAVLNKALKFVTFQSQTLKTKQRADDRLSVMRVVGVPGDTVKVKNNVVSILTKGGERFLTEFELTENSYNINFSTYPENWNSPENPFNPDTGEIPVNDGFYFLMGDNRELYPDSRVSGLVPEKSIRGKVILRYWPFKRLNVL